MDRSASLQHEEDVVTARESQQPHAQRLILLGLPLLDENRILRIDLDLRPQREHPQLSVVEHREQA